MRTTFQVAHQIPMPPARLLRYKCDVLLPATSATSGGDEHALRSKGAELLRGEFVPGYGFLKYLVSISSESRVSALRALHDGSGRVAWPVVVVGAWVACREELGEPCSELLYVPSPGELAALRDDAARLEVLRGIFPEGGSLEALAKLAAARAPREPDI